MAGFAELAARSHYSFLEGSASPPTLVEAARKAGTRGVIGAELDLDDGDRLRLVARNRDGYRQLSRAISAAQLAGVKGQPRLRLLGLVAGTAATDAPTPRRRRPTLPPPQ